MSTTSHTGGRRFAFYTFTFLAGLWFWVFLADPTMGRAGEWAFGQAVWVAAAWKFRTPKQGGETPVLPVEAHEPTETPQPEVEPAGELEVSPAPKQQVLPMAGPSQELHIDLTNPGKLLDCCYNCGNRELCYQSQRELVGNWDYLCDKYQRDDALDAGRVVDMGKGRR